MTPLEIGTVLAGSLIVVFAVVDALWTTLTVSGAGWLSIKVAGCVARSAMRGPKVLAENASIAGLCASFVMWSTMLWFGWSLVFCGTPQAVVEESTLAPASIFGIFYFVGFTLTTLGIGDLKPLGEVWQFATVLTSVTGFLTLTLFVTYCFSVITALNARRSIGASVGHLGNSAEEIAALLLGGGQQFLGTRLLDLADQLESSAMQTDAYPVLEYSHVNDVDRSFSKAVVKLGEITFLLEFVIAQDQSLPAAVWKPLRGAVNLLIAEKHSGGNSQQTKEPGLPDLAKLKSTGLVLQPHSSKHYSNPQVTQMRSSWQAWLKWHRQP